MKRISGALAIACCLASQARAEEVDITIIDPMIDSVFRQLAIRHGFSLVAATDLQAAKIGYVYYVTEPKCASDLTAMAREGTPVRLFLAWESASSAIPDAAPGTEWTAIRLGSAEAGLRLTWQIRSRPSWSWQ